MVRRRGRAYYEERDVAWGDSENRRARIDNTRAIVTDTGFLSSYACLSVQAAVRIHPHAYPPFFVQTENADQSKQTLGLIHTRYLDPKN